MQNEGSEDDVIDDCVIDIVDEDDDDSETNIRFDNKSVTKATPVNDKSSTVATATSKPKVIKQKGDKSYVSNLCDFCNTLKSNHYCVGRKE